MPALRVAPSAPKIDHLLAVAVDGDRGPDLSPVPEVRPERVSYPTEAIRNFTAERNIGRRHPSRLP